jgi:hypothetical protein
MLTSHFHLAPGFKNEWSYTFVPLHAFMVWTATDIIIIIIIIVIIIIIIILGISFMQGIYTYIPETNHVPREHCVAAILM